MSSCPLPTEEDIAALKEKAAMANSEYANAMNLVKNKTTATSTASSQPRRHETKPSGFRGKKNNRGVSKNIIIVRGNQNQRGGGQYRGNNFRGNNYRGNNYYMGNNSRGNYNRGRGGYYYQKF